MNESVTTVQPAEGLRGDVEVVEPSRAERTIARRSAETRATIPTIELSSEIAMDSSVSLERELGCGTIALVVRASAAALREFPRVNGAYRDGRYELYSRVNVGVTLIDRDIYVTPTILEADEKSPAEIAAELAGFYERLRSGEDLRGNEAAGATFTVLDATAQQITQMTPIVTPPQAAALAAGPVRPVPVLRDGAVVPGQTLTATLSVDHRIVYGQLATSFLGAIAAHLEEARGVNEGGFAAADDPVAERIAARGREALLARLRTVYAEAAVAHADVVTVDPNRIEAMAQAATDRADGLQWRQALASVAAEELQISVAEALSDPAVARAQELIDAPSYEDELAELAGDRPQRSEPTVEPELPVKVEPGPPVNVEPGPPADVEPGPPAEAEPEQAAAVEPAEPDQTAEHESIPATESEEPLDLASPDELLLEATHAGGVANLPTGDEVLGLRLSESGLDILRSSGEIVGRLPWEDIEGLEVPAGRRLLRRHRHRAQLQVRTKHGDATFDVPQLTADELGVQVDAIVDLHTRGDS